MSVVSDVDVRLLHERYRRDHRPEDREALVLRFLPLARHLAHRYRSVHEREDLEQVAALALVKAIERFDPSRGIAFTSFAVPTILGEIKRYFRDLGWSVRVPRSLQELSARLDRAGEDMTQALGRPPTVQELADRCETTAERVIEARSIATAHHPESLDRPVRDEDGSTTLLQLLGDDEPGFGHVEQAADVSQLLEVLPARDRAVVRLRFQDDLVQRDIAKRLGISQMQVSRILTRAIGTLHDVST